MHALRRATVTVPATVALLALAACAPASAPAAQTSPATMFRGDARRTGVYDSFPGSTLVGLQWRLLTEGDVISSPVVVGDVMYVGSGDAHVYAADLMTGETRWRTWVGSAVGSSPAVGHGLVFVATRNGRVHALDASSGKTAWSTPALADAPWPWGHESGDHYLSSPALAGDLLVVGLGDGTVRALDARSGRERWTARTGSRVRSSPAIADGVVVVGSADGHVYAFSLESGQQRWRFATEGTKLESGRFGFDRRTVQSSPAIANGRVFVGARDGWIYALDLATGAERWRFDHKVSWINTSPAVAEGVVYAASSDARFIHALDAETGAERWRTTTGVTWSSPAVSGDMLYAGSGDGHLSAFDRRTGALRWRFRTGASVFSSPTPARGLVVVGSADGGVYALRVSDGPAVERVVFHDSAYRKAAFIQDPEALASALESRGYRRVNASALEEMLRARIADRAPSVVVFAVDYLPPAIADSAAPERSLLRRYLDAGGKVVWASTPPMLFPRDPATGNGGGLESLNWRAPARLTGVSHDASIFDARGAIATHEGRLWGLPGRWRAGWGIAPDSSITVLGRDEWGLAASWARSFGGARGTGFVLVPATDPHAVFLAAEYRPMAAR